mmetsp:Transcript_12612/g.31014  ORF Transcript_12612/g.31014 Transcript_12612/m.31014 type:complete len:129 (-) Transcript_12612:369-755(-)|eukprot:CAMPEP_0114522232 /NCGR_PEP_ID=MMETSP0109-20121206/20633_1 /TAXON_ID=29199 /ORGANISM="Chlorarachnion reptans, Strain CCCM449" /LENGTH=128 /DNA_ID=CAMNT_0001703437 /DNA_START=31 /DNA_END=417 /DNA_ORIENTATION=+
MTDARQDPSEFYLLKEGEKKVIYEKDEKLTNCGVLKIFKEDATFGNIVRSHLLRDKRVLFAGYRIPHPLYPEMHMKVRTTAETNPQKAIQDAIGHAKQEAQNIEKAFKNAIKEFSSDAIDDGYEERLV